MVASSKGVPFYGRYTGAIAGHATAKVLDADHHPTVNRLLGLMKAAQPECNHVICTRYDDETMYMPTHSDKTHDLRAGYSSPAASQHCMHLWCMMVLQIIHLGFVTGGDAATRFHAQGCWWRGR